MNDTKSTAFGLLRRCMAVAIIGSSLLAAAGCARDRYRHQADREVYSLVECGTRDPRWQLQNYTIEPDSCSRLHDPYCLDCPPMPPDDPTSHELMHCVDGKQGWAHWHDYGDTPYVENPYWKTCLPVAEDGTLVLDRETAVEMSLLHSREYQQELEDLYLSALDVTFERFRFDVQFFGGNSTFFSVNGPLSGSAASDSILTTDSSILARRALATGGELVAGVANSVLWEFGGPNSYSVSTPITFALMQPLLRAAGRAVVLEGLTNAERALLANIRQMERFRQGFYALVVAGRSGVTGPTPTGIRIPGSGGGFSSNAGGFIGLLEEQVRIRNLEENMAGNQRSLDQMEAMFEANLVKSEQVQQIRQSLLGSQSRLLSSRAGYQRLLDNYKMTLGLPPELDVRIEDPLLKQFELIDPAMDETTGEVDGLLAELRKIFVTATQQRDREVPVSVEIPADWANSITAAGSKCRARLPMVEQDLQRFGEALPARRQYMTMLSRRDEARRGEIYPPIYSVELLDQDRAQLAMNLAGYHQRIEQLLGELERNQIESDAAAALASGSLETTVDLLRQLSETMLELSLTQARARLGTITLLPIELSPEEAVEIARLNRLDWMNARAALVDQWRQIEIAANALKSDLDLVVEGQINPLSQNLSSGTTNNTTGQLRFGLEFDAPLTRLAERNAYRRSLIAYQQAKRAYYTFEDSITRNLREAVRLIRVSQLDFEVQREAVLVAIRRVDETQLELNAPQPAGGGGRSTVSARDVQQALQSLLDTRNQFLAVWVDYEVQRMNLDLDLGTMRLDDRSLWIDPGPVTSGQQTLESELETIPMG